MSISINPVTGRIDLIGATEEYVNEIIKGGGGFVANIWFTTIDSDVSGYKKISYTSESTEYERSGTISNEELLFRTYLFDGAIGVSLINAGIWSVNFRTKVDKTSGVTQLAFEPFLYHSDTTETVLFKAYSDRITNTDFATMRQSINEPSFSCSPTDRFGVRVYGKTTSVASVTITNIIGGVNGSYFSTPLSLRHSLLRELDYASSGHTGFQPAGDYVTVDQSIPQVITGGVLSYSSDHDEFTDSHQIVDKEYVDNAVTAINTSYYLLDSASGISDYKDTQIDIPSATSATDVTLVDATDKYLQGWISPSGGTPTLLVSGLYNLYVEAKVDATSGYKKVKLYWKLVEYKADTSEVVIGTSELSEELTTSNADMNIHYFLPSNYTPTAGSRIVGKVYASLTGTGNNPTATLTYLGTVNSNWSVPSNTEVLSNTFDLKERTRYIQLDGDLYGMYAISSTKKLPYYEYGNGITITSITVQCSQADPTTELNANIMKCDAQGTGAFPGANPTLIKAIDTTTGNYSWSGTEAVATGKELYLIMDANVDYGVFWTITIGYIANG